MHFMITGSRGERPQDLKCWRAVGNLRTCNNFEQKRYRSDRCGVNRPLMINRVREFIQRLFTLGLVWRSQVADTARRLYRRPISILQSTPVRLVERLQHAGIEAHWPGKGELRKQALEMNNRKVG